jgi:hypothetical protein
MVRIQECSCCPVIDAHDRAVEEFEHLSGEPRCALERVELRQTRGQQRPEDLGPVGGRLRLDGPPQALAVHAQQALEDLPFEPALVRELDQGDRLKFVVAHPVPGSSHAVPDRFPRHRQHVQGDARPFAHFLKGRVADAREPFITRLVQEGERELAGADRLADVLRRDPGAVEAAHEPHNPACGAGERAIVRRSQDPERDEPIDVPGVNSAAIGESVPREPVSHVRDGSHSPAGRRLASTLCSSRISPSCTPTLGGPSSLAPRA